MERKLYAEAEVSAFDLTVIMPKEIHMQSGLWTFEAAKRVERKEISKGIKPRASG